MINHCDWGGKCKRKAYVEVYPYNPNELYEGTNIPRFGKHWYYLCFWHFILARLKRYNILWCRIKNK